MKHGGVGALRRGSTAPFTLGYAQLPLGGGTGSPKAKGYLQKHQKTRNETKLGL